MVRLGWKVNADLPNPDSFDAATQSVTEEQVSEQSGCDPDGEEHVEKVKPFVEAGFTEVALVQIGAEPQEPFFAWAERELLPALSRSDCAPAMAPAARTIVSRAA